MAWVDFAGYGHKGWVFKAFSGKSIIRRIFVLLFTKT